MILITGASKGIGKFLFEQFSKTSEDVYGTYFSENGEFEKKVNYYQLDITDFEQTSALITKLHDKITKLSLINCAGNNYTSFAHKSDPELWKDVVMTNLVGTYHMIRASLPIMREQGYGRIINFSSIVAEVATPGTSGYAASKAGLWGMTKSMAVENGGKGITINNLNLGYFNIGMISDVSPEFQKIVKSKIPTGEFGDPHNIFNAVKFIIDSDYINGSSIDINGGIF